MDRRKKRKICVNSQESKNANSGPPFPTNSKGQHFPANDQSTHISLESNCNRGVICSENLEDTDIPDNSGEHVLGNYQLTHISLENNCNRGVICSENREDTDIPANSENDESDGDLHESDADDSTNYEEFSSVDNAGENSQYINFGQPIYICEFCGASMWYEERVGKHYNATNPKFSLCFLQGKIVIPPYPTLPQPLYDLYHKRDRRSKFFLENIRSFNSMFAFTSMWGKVDNSLNNGKSPPMFVMNGENYHQIGSLLPLPGRQPKFAQLYIYDTDNEIGNRMASVRMKDDNSSLKSTIVKDIKDMLDDCNEYVKTYRNVRDTLVENNVPTLKLRILRKRGRDGRRYNLPTASEVAALIVGDYDASDFERDVIVETQSGLLQRISSFDPSYLPLQYPLLFPRGEDGFRRDIEFSENTQTEELKRQHVSQKEWVAYRIQQRTRDQSTILFAKRLFQQFLVDCYSMIEYWRLRYARDHQKDLRADMYKGLTEAVLRGETDPTTVGKRIVLPSTFVGGTRYMVQNYQDAMAICGWIGYPDLFITFTCNHKWPELVDFLKLHNLSSEDRPDLACRLFKMKLDHLIKEIKKGQIFGQTNAVIYTIEFQKRGLPHAHILVFLKASFRCVQPQDIDKIISAEIPDKEENPELFNIVTSLMIHGPCGPQNQNSPCMQKQKCTKHFPKKFVENTVIDADGYPIYKRRDNGVSIKKGDCFVDNRYVVPYNPQLLLKYNAHINVEWCNQSRSIKYLFKYVNKGHDRVTASFYNGGNGSNGSQCFDEIKMYYDCRYLSACEAAWRIFSFDIHYRDPSVQRLNFHLENEQHVVFEEEESIDDVVHKKCIHKTKFLAWMAANKKYPEAKNLTYSQFPLKFVWKQKGHKWVPRKKGLSIGRIHFAPPGSGEIFYLRTLLNYVTGPTSYDEIKTVDNIKYDSYKDACYAMGLLNDDKEYIDGIIEASHWGTGTFLRNLFARLLVSDQLSKPEVVWNSTWQYLSDDILYIQRQLLGFQDLVLTDDQLKLYALAEIEMMLQSHGTSLEEYRSMPQPDMSLIPERQNRLIFDELNYDRQSLA